ncbi:transglutaminase superfamily protein [Kordia periserrulae]|uniref:Transglutaminase superfamily protein n=1 Tax=Kordia periserrulae TaxID=701523 RepID=A0A2T6C5R2_9FLAO|nr:DUF3857 domain-containing transglutaminase family protein [Kordia periserrulae]PTX63658.1 transglutaminase superfamily protein [Kordia periserrulae]
MRLKFLATVAIIFAIHVANAQDNLTSYLTLPQELTKNANAVIRLDETTVTVNATDDMEVSKKRIVTVLNENGLSKIQAGAGYDNSTSIKDLEARIYDKFGKQIKKIRERDFQDVSAVDGVTMYSDSRIKYMDYTPISYPFTVVFTSTVNYKTTANLPRFSPLSYYTGIQKSKYQITYPESLSLYKKELNLEEFGVVKIENPGKLIYVLDDVSGMKPEAYSPSEAKIKPQVYLALSKFTYEGISAEVKDWDETGKWIYDNLLLGRATVDAETKAAIENLVADATSDIEKARRIYEYMQGKTRYISVQVGIGGYQPIEAAEVDKVGYGDCKGLTNYMMALLKIAGIESYYTVVQSGSEIVNFYEDFATLGQGNHVILNLPNNGDDIWLECTSQKMPFGHIGDFTDDRNVLVVTPEGGQLKHTKKYATEENLQETTGNYTLDANGNIDAEVTIKTYGIQYDSRFYIEDFSDVEKDKRYKKYFYAVNNVNIDNIELQNDKKEVVFTEKVAFNADAYGVVTGDRLLFAPNAFNRISSIPDRYRNRKFPLEIQRGYQDVDSYEIKLPSDFKIEAMPDDVSYETKFGSYSFSIEQKDNQTLQFTRKITIKDGLYPKEEYSNYRKFIKKIVKYDSSKIVLVKK